MKRAAVVAMVVLVALAGAPPAATGQRRAAGGAGSDPWTALTSLPPSRSPRARSFFDLGSYQALALDQPALEAQLEGVPSEVSPGAGAAGGQVVSLPAPDGSKQRFRVVEVAMMAPELAARAADLHVYRGQGIDDPAATLGMEVTPLGVTAQVLTPRGAWYVDPYYHLDTSAYVSYFKRDLRSNPHDWSEQVLDGPDGADHGAPPAPAERSGTQLRLHRFAVAASGEYTAFWGSVPGAQAGLVQMTSRLSQIYEQEVAVRLILVSGTSIIFTDAATDPYANECGDIVANQGVINGAVGSANYDVGHVVTTASGGCASLGVVGVNGFKARGTTGTSTPVNDPFVVDYVAHEVGHQYGGAHTFNGIRLNCAGANRNGATAYEPGSGSTIQAYAGICGLDDLQLVGNGASGASDPYFHSASFDQIVNHTTGGNPGDIGAVANGNTVPTATAGDDGVIPASTPFLLRGAGTDANGDSLTYDWQQRDLGAARALDNPQITAGPLFRAFAPTASPVRYLPKLSAVVAGTTNVDAPCPALTATIGAAQACWSEIVPTVAARTMNFRMTVRDNRAGGGGVNTDDLQVTVADTGAPFEVTSQATAGPYAGGNDHFVVWNVAGTNEAPVSASTVDVLLSTDGGVTFPTTLVSGTPNDGSQLVTFPGTGTTTARIMVVESGAGTGVRFYNVNSTDFTITAVAPQLRVTTSPAVPAEISVDGVVRDSWGLNWVNFPAGAHQVCFGDVPGYTKPPCEDVNLTEGNTTTVQGTYTQNGYLRAITSPAVPSTVSVDGVPRNDWGLWTEIPPGTYEVCFGAVAGSNTPSCRDVEVVAGATATTTGTFTPNGAAPGPGGSFGYLRATTSPANVAMISVDGQPRDNWGLNWLKLPTGSHDVCFGASPNLTAPATCIGITITDGATTELTGFYVERGFLRVQTSPAVPATITVNGSIANAWGVWTSKEPGTYAVCFGEVPGFTAPPCQDSVSVTVGNTTTITGTYTPIQ